MQSSPAIRIAFQGETGAFSEEALQCLHPGAEGAPFPSFEKVFEALGSEAADQAVIPIENSLFGSVHECYDLLRIHDVSIIGELKLRIRHNLIGFSGASLEDIRVVRSHPQALGQCRRFLRMHLSSADVIAAYDTAGAVRELAQGGGPNEAAIGSERAAAVYGLEILEAGIESNHQNYTRFLLLSPKQEMPPPVPDIRKDWKTSIVFSMRTNVPGALFKSLAVFALRELDLFKIESRPLVGSPGNYRFYLDVLGAASDKPVELALDHLREIASYLKVLGSYRSGKTQE
ncbi:MAG: prephenate dehydratase [Bacteroidetes bacterium SB0662_bin_6]|nr:prephenate dehydratase [Bacteroidetes bacterium SB0668_bin_1]MYE04114.1 prephenate dehydratase [Bacteroidetes bacterium SB0662_bin_6]